MSTNQSKRRVKEKINIFSRDGLKRMFPGAKIVRRKTGWDIIYPLPEVFWDIKNIEIISKDTHDDKRAAQIMNEAMKKHFDPLPKLTKKKK